MKASKEWVVVKDDSRPAGKDDECFYCQQKMGAIHSKGCVIRGRTIVVEVKIRLVREIPEDWDTHLIEFQMNDGSWCASNIVDELDKLEERFGENHCLCQYFEGEYVREATKDDEETQKLFIDKIQKERR